MRLKKDLFSDILYGSIIGIVLLIREPVVQGENLESLALSNLIIVLLFYLWLFTLSSKFTKSIFISSKEKYSNLEITKSGARIISQMIQMKVAIYIILFIVFSLFRGNFNIDNLNLSSIVQLLTSSVYVISIYSLMQFVGEKSYFNWSFPVALFLPILIFMLLYSFFNIENSEYFALIPMNFYMIIDINDKLIIASSSVSFVLTFFLFAYCLKLIKEGKKKYNLPSERVN